MKKPQFSKSTGLATTQLNTIVFLIALLTLVLCAILIPEKASTTPQLVPGQTQAP